MKLRGPKRKKIVVGNWKLEGPRERKERLKTMITTSKFEKFGVENELRNLMRENEYLSGKEKEENRV